MMTRLIYFSMLLFNIVLSPGGPQTWKPDTTKEKLYPLEVILANPTKVEFYCIAGGGFIEKGPNISKILKDPIAKITVEDKGLFAYLRRYKIDTSKYSPAFGVADPRTVCRIYSGRKKAEVVFARFSPMFVNRKAHLKDNYLRRLLQEYLPERYQTETPND